MTSSGAPAEPLGVRLAVAYFVLSGTLEILLTLVEVRPLGFWPVWDACVRGGMDLLLAAGLRRRYAICRSIAMIYCLAVVSTYAAAVGLAVTGAPLRYPVSIVVQSLLHIPSGAVLFLYLRKPLASAHFRRPLFPRRRPPTPEDRTCSGPRRDL
jgi:hypothetical protein